MDRVDRRILHIWLTDARLSLREVAKHAGVSATTVHDRARSMRERGVIRGTHLDVDLGAIGRPVQALVSVQIRPPSRVNIEGFRDWVLDLPQTLGVFVISGHADFLVHVAVATNDELYAFVIDHLTSRDEIADVQTAVVYEHLRRPLTL